MNVTAVTSATDTDIENDIFPYVNGDYKESGLTIVNIKANNGGRLLGLISQNGHQYGMCFVFSFYWTYLKLYRLGDAGWTVTTIS
jgi:hypothetical protein